VTNELGAAFPDAKVYGIDLTPVPALRPKLENIEYIEGNVFELTSPGVDTRIEKGSFDYVFSRFLMAGMTEWERYVKLCAALTKPGVSHLHPPPSPTDDRSRPQQLTRRKGWVEMQEPDISVRLSPPVSGNAYDLYLHTLSLSELEAEKLPRDECDPEPWRATLHNLFRARGFELSIGSKLARYFADAGLQDVRIKRYVYPYGTWKGMTDAQRHYAPINKNFVENEMPALMRKLSIVMGTISSEETDRLIEKSREFVERFEGNREFGWVYVVCGRKADGEQV
jgi:hypothetical protein